MTSEQGPTIFDTFRQLETIGKHLKRKSFHRATNPNIKNILDLSVRQLACLGAVKDLTAIHTDGISLKQLASFLGLTLPASSLLVDSMVKKGLLQRKENPSDRRVLCILLSDIGKEAFMELSHEIDVSVGELIKTLPKEDQAHLMRITQQLFENLEY